MLDKRAQTLLKTLIERYIVEGQPVGSRTLSRHSGLELSPATIRNVMSDLEEMGLIVSPHTSAGRIPTALGYRLFVDTLLTVKPLGSTEISELQGSIQTHQPQLAINTASLQLVPTTVIALRASAHSSDPAGILLPTLASTCCALIVAILAAKILERVWK